jgi:lipopolysaccharide biosynthesis regulator YciM
MWEAGLFTLIVIAIAAGWVLGRYGRNLWRSSASRSEAGNSSVNSAGFYRGLDFLINDSLAGDKPDEAVEVFIQSLDINRETLDLHLALGNLLRRKGEVDRAIRVHRNLLAKAVADVDSRQIQLELARDFIAAGLLDRAEQTLLELVPVGGDVRHRAASLLIEIYQSEKEWGKAIDATGWLEVSTAQKRRRTVADETRISLAHFHCEIAEQSLRQKNVVQARHHIRQALLADRHCVRASLLEGRLLLAQQRPRRAIRALRKVEFQQAEMLPETISLLVEAFAQLADRHAFVELLRGWVEKYPRSSLVLALTTELEREQGDVAAATLLAEQLKSRPSLRGLNQLIEYHLQHADGRAQENLGLLKTLINALVVSKPVYQCDNCGFSGQQLHWQCPSCKKWGHIKPIAGVEGE